MEETPILSIITPVYNGEKFISSCIDCVVAQNCTGVEHIVVEDGSTDRTVEILREKAKIHPHLRWVSEPHRGQSDAMNKGISLARAEYIGFLNVDDFYEPGALCRVSEIISNLAGPRFVVGACNILTIDDKVLWVNRPKILKFENYMVDDERWEFPFNPSAYFYPKSLHNIIGPYNAEEHFAMDFEFILGAVQAIEPLYIDTVLGNFRRIPGTKTHSTIVAGSSWAIRRKIRARAWKRAPLKIKIRIASLWIYNRPYRLKVSYWNFRRRFPLFRPNSVT